MSSALLGLTLLRTELSTLMGFFLCLDFIPIKAGCNNLEGGMTIFYVGFVLVEVTPSVPWFSGSGKGCGSRYHLDDVEEIELNKCHCV